MISVGPFFFGFAVIYIIHTSSKWGLGFLGRHLLREEGGNAVNWTSEVNNTCHVPYLSGLTGPTDRR